MLLGDGEGRTGACFGNVTRLVAAMAVASLLQCSRSSASPPEVTGGADGGLGGAGGGDSEGGPMFGGVDGAVSPPPTGGCSADLRRVVDALGKTVQTCTPEQGCADSKCVDACTAASASHGYVGCRFVLATPAFQHTSSPPCFAAFVANNWTKDAAVTVSRAGQTYDVTQFGRIAAPTPDVTAWAPLPPTGIPPGEVGVFFLNGDGGFRCPILPAAKNTAVWTQKSEATGRGQAFEIKTSVPVTTYDILPFGSASSYLPAAELVLPTSAWGTNYVAMVPKATSTVWPQFGQVVAQEDGTTVTVVPTVDLPAGVNVVAAPKNAVTTFSLSAGEFIQWQDAHEMSGSVLSSNKPVAFVGGHGYLCLSSKTSSGGGCDSAHQMIPPVSALGSEYVSAPFLTRRDDLVDESILYRIVGAVDGTTLTFDPPVATAPTTLARGQLADFETTGAFRVSSSDAQHPFHIVMMMPGCPNSHSRPGFQTTLPSCQACLGDEEFVNMLPPVQFLSAYVFFTDPTYFTTNLALVRGKDTAGAFHDVTVDCVGVVKGWKAVGTTGHFQVTTVELVRGNVGIGSCTNGPHSAKSDGPFGLTVWGTDCASSYGYPAGGNASKVNSVVVDAVPR